MRPHRRLAWPHFNHQNSSTFGRESDDHVVARPPKFRQIQKRIASYISLLGVMFYDKTYMSRAALLPSQLNGTGLTPVRSESVSLPSIFGCRLLSRLQHCVAQMIGAVNIGCFVNT